MKHFFFTREESVTQNSDIRLIIDVAESVRNAAPIQKDPEDAQLIGQHRFPA
ncbi:hypothetical protein GCM10027415_26850 [Humibacter ginsengisoli]